MGHLINKFCLVTIRAPWISSLFFLYLLDFPLFLPWVKYRYDHLIATCLEVICTNFQVKWMKIGQYIGLSSLPKKDHLLYFPLFLPWDKIVIISSIMDVLTSVFLQMKKWKFRSCFFHETINWYCNTCYIPLPNCPIRDIQNVTNRPILHSYFWTCPKHLEDARRMKGNAQQSSTLSLLRVRLIHKLSTPVIPRMISCIIYRQSTSAKLRTCLIHKLPSTTVDLWLSIIILYQPSAPMLMRACLIH